jgi:uncharacterized protein YdaU (DUF1376 family)
MAKPDIWMPLYIRDYLADTQHLTAAQHGHYLLAIMAYWMRGGPLPNDDEQLCRICRIDAESMRNGCETDAKTMRSHELQVLRSFFKEQGDVLTHTRIERELSAARAKSESAKNSAVKRWQKPSNYANAYPKAYAESMRNACSSPSPSPSQSDIGEVSPITPQQAGEEIVIDRPSLRPVKNPTKKELALTVLLPPQIDTPEFRAAWADWVEHRWQKRAFLTEMAAKQQIRNCAALGLPRAIAAIQNSIGQGYTGLFEAKEQENGQSRPPHGNFRSTADERRAAQAARECDGDLPL